MAYASLREFLERLEKAGRLVRVTAPVSTVLEMTEIQTRVLAEGGADGARRRDRLTDRSGQPAVSQRLPRLHLQRAAIHLALKGRDSREGEREIRVILGRPG